MKPNKILKIFPPPTRGVPGNETATPGLTHRPDDLLLVEPAMLWKQREKPLPLLPGEDSPPRLETQYLGEQITLETPLGYRQTAKFLFDAHQKTIGLQSFPGVYRLVQLTSSRSSQGTSNSSPPEMSLAEAAAIPCWLPSSGSILYFACVYPSRSRTEPKTVRR